MNTFKLIENWVNKKLRCERCLTTKSVKYEYKSKYFCNKCIVKEIKNRDLNSIKKA